MFRFTHTASSPWTVIRANDKRRTRLEAIRFVLARMHYAGKDNDVVGEPDAKIIGCGPQFFYAR
jgi:polyphosphate kinase